MLLLSSSVEPCVSSLPTILAGSGTTTPASQVSPTLLPPDENVKTEALDSPALGRVSDEPSAEQGAGQGDLQVQEPAGSQQTPPQASGDPRMVLDIEGRWHQLTDKDYRRMRR